MGMATGTGGVRLAQNTYVFRSPLWQDIFRKAERLASLKIPIIITGESGVGKFLLAEKIHSMGKGENLVRIPCPNIPEALFDTEVFGNVKGAFTGAISARAGLLAGAQGGTALFDEITYLSIENQGKLLYLL